MPFGMLTRVGPTNHVLDGVQTPPLKGAILGVFGRLKSIVKHRILEVGYKSELYKNTTTNVNDPYTSYDVFLRNDVPMKDVVDHAAHLRSQIPPKLFWGVNMAFSRQTRNIVKPSYYQNYCIDSNQSLHNSKDHQIA